MQASSRIEHIWSDRQSIRFVVSLASNPDSSVVEPFDMTTANAVDARKYSRLTRHLGSDASGWRTLKRVAGADFKVLATFRIDSRVLLRTRESSSLTAIFITSKIRDSLCLLSQRAAMSPSASDTEARTIWLPSSTKKSRRTCTIDAIPSLHSLHISFSFFEAIIFTSGSLSLSNERYIGRISFVAMAGPTTFANFGIAFASSFLTFQEVSSPSFCTIGQINATKSFESSNVVVSVSQILTACNRMRSESSVHTSFNLDMTLSLILSLAIAFAK
mmetsp:Transcript_34544/g.83567  ORF Transcript_34544/g.83567 Transcript_34544/m.83567 type:complete len:274 (+) Transcript_34544:782-1603(+)